MLSLNDREWKEFLFPEVFLICGGFYNKKPVADEKGTIPFVGATDSNNGFTQFCTVEEIDKTSKTGDENNASLDKKIYAGNCIAVTNNGSVGYAYYQKHDFTCSHDVNPLYLRNAELNENIAKFLIATIEQQRLCFTYVHKWRPKRMRKSRIMLPINSDGMPDYDFMDAYISEMEHNKIGFYIDYCKKRLKELDSLTRIDEIEDKEWKEFFVSDIFDTPKRGKRIISDNYADGNMAVVSSAGGNNGVIAFAGNTEKVRIYGDCLSVANGGVSAGYAFYHPYDFIATDHVTHFKGDCLNKYHYLFLATIIKNQMHEKYDFSREMTDPRLQREKVIVPVNSDGKPDYYYMEQYAKNLMIKKYRSYIDFLKKEDKDIL